MMRVWEKKGEERKEEERADHIMNIRDERRKQRKKRR